MFTIDPGDYVVDDADNMSEDELARRTSVRWRVRADEYAGKTFTVANHSISASRAEALCAALKYGAALDHAARMCEAIAAATSGRRVDIEMSVDETTSPTTPFEHYFIGCELRRRGVKMTSLAPRFYGEFEKGIDFKGDLSQFERELEIHVAIADACGPYKLSLHSGSDKFSVYPCLAKTCKGRIHVKTAGTSYLEAVRAIAKTDERLFREICACAREHYEQDRKTYHVSADLANVPPEHEVRRLDALVEMYLAADDGSQVLHVTYGTVLNAPHLRMPFFECLDNNEETHYSVVAEHIRRHVEKMNES